MLLTDKYADKIYGIITCYDCIQKIIAETGKTEGLVHTFSAMKCCNTYKPWHDKTTLLTGTLAFAISVSPYGRLSACSFT